MKLPVLRTSRISLASCFSGSSPPLRSKEIAGPSPRRAALTLVLLFCLTGCGESHQETTIATGVGVVDIENSSATRPQAKAERLDGVRSRADAAFAKLGSEDRTQSQSRIGLQPWPEDLPARWPRPNESRVLADTSRHEGDRLLLVDVPDDPAAAATFYQAALLAEGYEVDRTSTRRVQHALHASLADHEVVLTFLPREKATRIEILFLRGATS